MVKDVKFTQSRLTLCNPIGCTVHGILQATILEWVAFTFSRKSSQPRVWTHVSCITGGFFTSWATREAQEVTYPFSSGSSQPRNRTCVSCIASKFFTNWAIREAPNGKETALNARDLGSTPGSRSGRSPGEGNGNALPYSCLESCINRGAWWLIVHGIAKSQTWLSDFYFLFTSFNCINVYS